MADLLSSLSSTTQSSSSSDSSQADLLVEAYRRTRQPELDALTQKKSSLQQKQVFYNNLKTKLNTLISQFDIFTASTASQKFITRNITSSDSTVLTASADETSVTGANTIKVNRLASNDLLVSKQVNLSDSFGGITGTKSFDLTVNGVTQNITVAFDGTENNQQAMTKIVNAINLSPDALDSDSKGGVTASIIKNTTTTAKITFTAKHTGGENNIQFSEDTASEPDANNRVLGRLGLIESDLHPGTAARTLYSGTNAGYKAADYNTLDANLEVNGIDVVRPNNTIDDVLNGVTLNLLKPQAADDMAVTLQTSVSEAGVENLIKPLLDSYNDLLKFFKNNPNILRNDSSINSLYSRVRATVSQSVTTASGGDPKYLTEIGIKIADDGTLSINDKTKLEDLLKEDPSKVANLFTTSDSFVQKLSSAVANLSGDDGLIKSKTKLLGDQIDSTTKKSDDLQSRIDKQADAMRKEYESMLRVYLEAQNQYSLLGNFQSSGTSSQ